MSDDLKSKSSAQKLASVIAIPVILAGLVILVIAVLNILKPQKYAGEMFGKKIKQGEFDDVYKYNRLQSLIRYGKAFESIEPLLDLDTEAWDQLLLVKEAQRQKVKVSDEDIIAAVAEYPYFFREGKFDSLLYRDIIRNSLKAEPKEFEESIRQSLLVEHLRDQVTGTVNLTDQELLAEFQKRRDLIQLQYVVVDDKPFLTGLTSSDDELKAYFTAHPGDFEVGESIKIEYVWLPFPADGGIQKQVETKFKGRAIIDRITKNKMTLKDAAATLKFESKESGFFTREDAPKDIGIDWNSEMTKSTFRMKKGELSAPLEQKTGYAVIKMIDKQEARTPSFEEIKDKVAAKVSSLKAQDLAAKKAEEYITQINTKIQGGMDFKAAAAELGLDVKDNNLTQRESVVSNLGIKEQSVDVLSKMTANAVGPVLIADQGILIPFLIKSVPVSEAAFQKTKESFRKLIIQERKDKSFEAFLKDLHKKADIKKY